MPWTFWRRAACSCPPWTAPPRASSGHHSGRFTRAASTNRKPRNYKADPSGLRQQLNALKNQVEVDYYVSAALAQRLTSLGFRLNVHTLLKIINSQRVELMQEKAAPGLAVRVAATSQKWRKFWEATLTPDEVKLLGDQAVWRELFHLLGRTDMHFLNLRRFLKLGRFSLQAAFEAGATDALYDHGIIELAATKDLPIKTIQAIRERAVRQDDWRAMTLYLVYRLTTAQVKEVTAQNYRIAKALYQLVRPGNQRRNLAPLIDRYELPWKLLHDAADHYLYHLDDADPTAETVQNDLDMALRQGVDLWMDPRAAEMLLAQSGEVQPHTERWVNLTTQAAMTGNALRGFELALYYLARDGWYPTRPTGPKPTSPRGLEWLALSAAAATDDARTMAFRYLGLAHILREHGRGREGYDYLTMAKTDINDAGLDPSQEMTTYLNGFQKHWYTDELVTSKPDTFLAPSSSD